MKKFSLVWCLIFMFVIGNATPTSETDGSTSISNYVPSNGGDIGDAVPSPPSPPSPRPPYSLLVLEWMRSNSYLSQQQFDTAPHEITIHGLWAAVKPCNGVPFNSTMMENWLKVNRNLERMESKWVSEKAGPLQTIEDKKMVNMRFWMHEWETHGKCSGLIQDAYFGMTLLMYEELIIKIHKGMNPALSSANPGNIQNQLPKRVRFTCTGQKGDNLYQIIMNVSRIDEAVGKYIFSDNNRPGNCTSSTQVQLP